MQFKTVQTNISINHHPLSVAVSLTPSTGSVGQTQSYDGATGDYTPDRELVPLTIVPTIAAKAMDDESTQVLSNSYLANIRWTEHIGNTERQIPQDGDLNGAGDPCYTLSGVEGTATAGTLTVRKNAEPLHPISLVFTASLVDRASGMVYPVKESILLDCRDLTTGSRMELDCAESNKYNPLVDDDEYVIHAKYFTGADEVTPPNVRFVWDVIDSVAAGAVSWREYDPVGELLDYELDIAADTSTCTVNRKIMGDKASIRCRAYLADNGTFDFSGAYLYKIVTFTRLIPALEVEMVQPHLISGDTSAISPMLIVSQGRRLLALGESGEGLQRLKENISFDWKTARLTHTSVGAYTTVGYGLNPSIPMSAVATGTEQASLKVDLEDLGPLKAWTDSDGKVLTDADGKILLIK